MVNMDTPVPGYCGHIWLGRAYVYECSAIALFASKPAFTESINPPYHSRALSAQHKPRATSMPVQSCPANDGPHAHSISARLFLHLALNPQERLLEFTGGVGQSLKMLCLACLWTTPGALI